MDALTRIVEGAARAKQSLVTFFYRNACVRHGVPIEGDEQSGPIAVEHQHTHRHEGLNISRPSTPADTHPSPTPPSESGPTTTPAEKTLLQKALPWLLAGAIPAAGAAGWGISSLTSKKPEQVVVDRTNYEGSLLQYIEDQGAHLPPEN